MRLVVTRPEEDGAKLAQALLAMGHEVVSAPLLQIEFLPAPEIPARDWQAVVGTSANSFASLAKHPRLASLTPLACACIGPASAQAAKQIGFRDIRISGGGLSELKELIAREFSGKAGPLLYVSGEVVSGELQLPGLEVVRVVAYRAVPAKQLPRQLMAALQAGRLDGVLLYSPRSARIWAGLVREAGLSSQARNVLHYCLSANVAAALPDGFPARIAAAPVDDEMLALAGAEKR